jgi:hypothetical protein
MREYTPDEIRIRAEFWRSWNVLVFLGLTMVSFGTTTIVAAFMNSLNVFGLGMLGCGIAPFFFVLERTDTWHRREMGLRRR